MSFGYRANTFRTDFQKKWKSSFCFLILLLGSVNSGFSIYNPGTEIPLNENSTPQTITFPSIPGKTFGDANFTLSASASSGLTVTYTSSNPNVATVNGNVVTIVGAGSTNITAKQTGNATFAAASDVVQLMTVSRASQTVTLEQIPDKRFGDPDFDIIASATSGLPVTFNTIDTDIVTVTGNRATIVGIGSFPFAAFQAGNSNYFPAFSVARSIVVRKGSQSISFTPPTARNVNAANFSLQATSSSGLPVTFSSSNSAVATTTSEGVVTITGVGFTNITATQSGNSNYDAATESILSLEINTLTDQAITFNSIANKQFGDPSFNLNATGGASGNAVTYTSSNTNVATIVNNTVTIVGVGSTNITASQSGDSNHNPAVPVVQSLTVNKGDQTIAFGSLSNRTYGDASFMLNANGGSSGNPVIYTSSNTNVATINGNTVTIVGAGSTNITAIQAGNAFYNDATPVLQSLTVSPKALTITANNRTITYGEDENTGNTVTYSGFITGENESNLLGSLMFINLARQNVGTYADLIIPSGQTSTNYSITYVSADLTVNKRNLVIKASDKTFEYGDDFNIGHSASYSGFASGEDESILNGTLQFHILFAMTTPAFYQEGVLPTGLTHPNYTVIFEEGSVTVNRKVLTITAVNRTITYGDDANTGHSVTYNGFITGEGVSDLSGSLMFLNITETNAGIHTGVIKPRGFGSTNYDINYVDGNLTIDKKALTVTANNRAITYGDDANSGNTVSYTGFISGENESVLGGTLTFANITQQNAGTYSGVIAPSGLASNNYNFNYQNGELVINKKTINITALNKTKLQGTSDPALEYRLPVGSLINGDMLSGALTRPFGELAGFFPIQKGTLTAGSNYDINFTEGVFSITTLQLQTITFNSLASVTYGDPAFALSAAGGGSGNPVTYRVDNPSVATVQNGLVTIVGAGAVNIIADQSGNSTYAAADPVVQTLTVTKAPLTIGIIADGSTYGNVSIPSPLQVSYAGFVNNETSAVLTTQPTTSTTATTNGNAGTYPATVSGATAANYNITFENGGYTIFRAPLTITADNKSATYGDSSLPTLTVSYSGFVNGETSSVLTNSPTLSTPVTPSSNVGTYNINVTGASADNYSITSVNGSLTVGKATLQVVANNQTRTYGAANPPFSLTYTGFKNNDDVSVLDTAPTGNTTATETSNVGSYTITASGGVDNNYDFTYTNGVIAVNPATLTITSDNKSKSYGSDNPVLTVSYSGFQNDEGASILSTAPTAITTANNTSSAGSYDITASGAIASNYIFNYIKGTLMVNPVTLTVTAEDKSRSYGAENPALTLTYLGFLNNETEAVLTKVPSVSVTADASSAVGTYEITPSGGEATNYTLAYTKGTLTVSPAVLTVTADNQNRTYGAVNPNLALTYSGFLNGDNETKLKSVPTVTTPANSESAVGTYELIPVGGAASNYSFSYVNGSLTVTKAILSVTANDATKEFGKANPSFSLNYSGFVNNENESVLTTIPALIATADESSSPGTYAIEVQGGAANNYTISGNPGTLTITKANQAITFAAIPEKATSDGSFDLGATSTSGLAVSYVSSDESIATITGSTVIILKAGMTEITASQVGDANYNAATTVSRQLIVNQSNDSRITSSITINSIADQTVGSNAITLSATTRPTAVPIKWEVVTGSATVDGNLLTLGTDAGIIQVKGSILETDDYKGSEDVIEFALLDETLVTPIIDFILPSEALKNESITLSATVDPQGATTIADSDVVYQVVSGPGVLSNGNELTFSEIGRVIVSASLAATGETNAISSQSSVEVIELYNVSGTIRDENGNVFSEGIVIVGDLNDLTNSQSTSIDSDGNYTFSQLRSGDYELFVTPVSLDYVMTFYGDVSPVLDPNAVPLGLNVTSDLTAVDVIMQLAPQTNIEFLSEEQGGAISFFAQNSQGNGSRFVLGKIENGDPLPNTLVILKTSADEYVTAGVTDDLGLIEFMGLPTGDYKILIDIPGVGEISADVGVVEGEALDVTALIDESGAAFDVNQVLSTLPEALTQVTIVPNPVFNSFELNTVRTVQEVQLFDASGKRVQRFGSQKLYNLQGIPEGVYILKVITNEGTEILRLLKH